MVSRNSTRQSLKTALRDGCWKKKGVTYPMAEFRHSIFETVDLCKLIKKVNWTFSPINKTTTAILIFKAYSLYCVYSYEQSTVTVYKAKEGLPMELCVKTNCNALPSTILKLQPKVKVVLKKKAVSCKA